MKQFLRSAAVIGSLCFSLSSCSDENSEITEYGEFSLKVTNKESRKILWFGENGRRTTEYELNYHGNPVDLNEKAPKFLRSEDKKDKVVSLEILDPFYGKEQGVYALLANGAKFSLVLLKPSGTTFDIIPIVNVSRDTSALCMLQDLQPIGDNKVLYANYVFDEKTLKTVAQFEPINRYYTTEIGDTSNVEGYAFTFYGISPDNAIVVRSFYPYMMDAHPELKNLFLSGIATGKTTVFPLMEGDKDLVETYNNKKEDKKSYQWFKENFEWEEVKGKYRLKIKSKILTPEKSTIK